MDANLSQILEMLENESDGRKEIYKRLNSLERWRSGITAAGTAVMTVFGLILKFGGK